jgi:phage gp36-like protein
MPYATVQDFTDWYTQEAVELSDLYDPSNGTVDTDRIEKALDKASREIDSYLRPRYPVPLTTALDELITPCLVIARYRLSRFQDKESRERLDFEDVLKWLKLIADGKVALNIPVGDDPSIANNSPQYVPGYRMDLEGFHA